MSILIKKVSSRKFAKETKFRKVGPFSNFTRISISLFLFSSPRANEPIIPITSALKSFLIVLIYFLLIQIFHS